MVGYFPKYFSSRAIALYVILLLVLPVLFGFPMYWYWWIIGFVEVGGFFYFSNVLSRAWSGMSGKALEKNLMLTSWLIRTIYVLFSFAFYQLMNGNPFEFSVGDAMLYDSLGREGTDMLLSGTLNWKLLCDGLDVSDYGYPFLLMLIYAVTGKSILIARLAKAVISAYTVVLVYRLARRNFGEDTARISAIFCMLMPNLVYYCGLHLKETEMLFVTVLFIERADALFRTAVPRPRDMIFLALVGVSAFFFRAVLCYVLFLTLVASVVLGSKRIKKGGKWAIEGLLLLVIGFLGYTQIGTSVIDTEEYENVQQQQESAMQWRSVRQNGNAYAKYASASIFAPLIFTIPFPTMVNVEHQQNQQMIHGGNYVKNITSFFTILAFIMLLLSGEWRDNIVPLAFVVGYLIVLAFSNFAQSERFHIPSLPFELIIASYGITHFKVKHKNWFTLWLVFIFIAIIGWSWFKLRGRGL